MRALRLVSVAFEAERARLGLRVQREIRRVALFAAAGVMGLAGFAMLHVVAWTALASVMGPTSRSLVIFAFDIIAAGILAFVATRNAPTLAEQEALAIRRTALVEARNGIGISLIPLAFTLFRNRRRRTRV